uniref:Uncharacterized protein n=1 Tax=Arundo donax TaxID=35708 RepID=A0A0A9GG40_ARUDO
MPSPPPDSPSLRPRPLPSLHDATPTPSDQRLEPRRTARSSVPCSLGLTRRTEWCPCPPHACPPSSLLLFGPGIPSRWI